MNWDEVAGKWNQVKGHIKERWGRLSDDDLTMINGHKDVLVGKLQEKYGLTREKAEEQIDEWKAPTASAEPESRRKAS